MREVLNMVKSKHLTTFIDGQVNTTMVWISFGMKHSLHNGQPYYYSQQQVQDLNMGISLTAAHLLKTEVKQGEQTAEESPYCYGEDMVGKFKVLGKVIKLPYLFIDVLGKTERWQKMHLSDKKERYYNQFTDEELAMINEGIRKIGERLMDIRLFYEESEKRKVNLQLGEAKSEQSENEKGAKLLPHHGSIRTVEDIPEKIGDMPVGQWVDIIDQAIKDYDCITTEEKLAAIKVRLTDFFHTPYKAGEALAVYRKIKGLRGEF